MLQQKTRDHAEDCIKKGVLVLVNRRHWTESQCVKWPDLFRAKKTGQPASQSLTAFAYSSVLAEKSHGRQKKLPLCNLYKEKSMSMKKKGSVFARLKMVQYWWMGTKQRSKKVTSLTSSQSEHCYAEGLKQKLEITAAVFYCLATLFLS